MIMILKIIYNMYKFCKIHDNVYFIFYYSNRYIYAAEHFIQQMKISHLAGLSIFSRVPITQFTAHMNC